MKFAAALVAIFGPVLIVSALWGGQSASVPIPAEIVPIASEVSTVEPMPTPTPPPPTVKPTPRPAKTPRVALHWNGPKTTVRSAHWATFEKYCPEWLWILPALCFSENGRQTEDRVGPGGRGVCMVNPIHQWRAGSGSLMKADTNIRVACQIIREQGPGPWTDYWNGYWEKYRMIP